jgi:hypothetical protein
MVERRQQERGGLAGAGLRLASDILAGQRQGQCLGLDRRAVFEAGLVHPAQQGLRQVQSGEGLVGEMVITHKTGRKHIILIRQRHF